MGATEIAKEGQALSTKRVIGRRPRFSLSTDFADADPTFRPVDAAEMHLDTPGTPGPPPTYLRTHRPEGPKGPKGEGRRASVRHPSSIIRNTATYEVRRAL
jgi:hypothetical protein